MQSGVIDLAVLPGPMWGPQLVATEVGDVQFGWMASPAIGLPDRVLTTEDFNDLPLLLTRPDGVAAHLFSQWEPPGRSPRKVVAAGLMAMLQMALAGLGVGSLPVLYLRDHLDAGRLVLARTDPPLPRMKFYAVHRKEFGNPLVARVAQLARSLCDFRHPGSG